MGRIWWQEPAADEVAHCVIDGQRRMLVLGLLLKKYSDYVTSPWQPHSGWVFSESTLESRSEAKLEVCLINFAGESVSSHADSDCESLQNPGIALTGWLGLYKAWGDNKPK